MLIVLASVLVLQIPFAYRRYQLGELSGRIAELQNQRMPARNQNYRDLKGVIHVHTMLGGHSLGGFGELIKAASSNALDFVVMTEHVSNDFDTSALTLKGFYGNTLFIGGNELETKSQDRFLLVNSDADAQNAKQTETKEFLQKVHAKKQIALITYPQNFNSWDSEFDGIEVFSIHTNAKKMDILTLPLDVAWSYNPYPELLLARYFQRPADALQKYDEVAAKRKTTLFAGSDAHSNIGYHLIGDDVGNKLLKIKLDDYATIFRLVRTHALLKNDEQTTQENLIEALKNGHTYIGFDCLSDTAGFSLSADNGTEQKIQGDEIALKNGVKLRISAPQTARFIIYKNGEKVFESGGSSEVVFDAGEPGTYRVEAYLDSLGGTFEKIPWILSNPVYVK